MNYSSHPKMKYLYIGIDCHKYTHTASMINCFNEELAVITFNNDKKGYESLIKKVEEIKKNLVAIFGLEDVKHLGYGLCQYLLSKNYRVKHINSNYTAAERKKQPIISKNDDIDANCVAKVLLDEFENLPNAKNDEVYWTLKQLVAMRKSIVKSNVALKNKLHAQLLYHYPNYNRVFKMVDTETALTFFDTYPSPNLLKDVSREDIEKFFKENTQTKLYQKKTNDLIELINEYDIVNSDYQEERNNIIKLLVKQLRQNEERMKELEDDILKIYDKMEIKLHTIPCISKITAVSLLAEIGNINRFQNSNKLAKYAGIAPIEKSSGGKDTVLKNDFGNRELKTIIHNIACNCLSPGKTTNTQIKTHNPIFNEYYYKKINSGKTKHQAILCVMRRLVNIIYKILKEDVEYQTPQELLDQCINEFRERKKQEEEKIKLKQELKEKHMKEKLISQKS